MDIKDVLEQRIKLERQATQYALRKNAKIYNIQRGYNNRICSMSPGALYYNTDLEMYGGAYSGLSQSLHDSNTERAMIEKKIKNIIPICGDYAFKVFERWSTYSSLKEYCDEYNIGYIKKEKYLELKNLVKKWRIASSKEHYKLSKQEKRKLKKLRNRTD